MMARCKAAGEGVGERRGTPAPRCAVARGASGVAEEGRAMQYYFGDYVLDTQRVDDRR